jgi:formate hydrogenlyase subunit 4
MGGVCGLTLSSLLAGLAIFMVAIAETSRVPVDNQETHLELTMIHEAMVLEYSGKSLALIELASYIKQSMFFVLISWYFFVPIAVGIVIVSLVMALIEMSIAKMRLFRAVDFLSFSFFLALVASIAACLGL